MTRKAAAWSAMLVLAVGHVMVAKAAAATEIAKPINLPELSDDMVGKLSASIMGESALVDKETGRIIWEGGTTTLSASLAPILGYGIKHVRATLLTGILLLAIVGGIMARIRRFIRASVSADSRSWPVTALLFLADWTIFRVPQLSGTFLLAAIALYLIESYTCSTRRYLANALSSPVEVEDYIEQLREEPPVVTWKLRCFHYERRKWISLVRLLTMRKEEEADLLSSSAPPSPWIFARKVVTHQAQSTYNYTR